MESTCHCHEEKHIHDHDTPDGHCHDHAHEDDHEECHCHDHAQEVAEVDAATLEGISDTRAVYRIMNMDCPMEEALIRKKLATVPGITNLEFNLMQRVLTVDHTGNTESIEAALKAIDMTPERLRGTENRGVVIEDSKIPWRKLAVATGMALFSEIFELLAEWRPWPWTGAEAGGWTVLDILALVLAVASIGLSGLGTFRKGWLAVSNFNLNINALMSVAVTGAVLIGQFPEAAMVMVLFNISEAIEAKALDRARNAIRDLMKLAPEKATIQTHEGWREVDVKNVPVDAIVRVRPGQKIALDGIVVSGESAVNQAPITGESMPVEKKPGDAVFGGTINESGSFEFRVTAAANDTTLARIIHAVEEAQATRAPMQRFVDAFAKYYTPAVFLLALVWALVPPLFFGAGWYDSLYTALVLLVIGCPCALVISTPVTVVSGMAAATRRGILIKGGLYLEMGRRLNWLALDKTGTLTHGQPVRTDLEIVGNVPENEAVALAVSLASRSDHPVSRAIANASKEAAPLEVSDFHAIPGKGVAGTINGQTWSLGSHSLVEALGKCSPDLEKRIFSLESQGKSVVALVGPNGVAAIFAVADTVRKSAIEAISELKALNVKTMMLTGDNEHTAQAIARETGVNEFRAGLLPQQKLDIIENLEKPGNIVGMVGDGINDAPALARANIGFAMAKGGTDTAIETADVALMDDDLRKIPRFIRLSRATQRILVENISLALGIKAVFFALTLSGNATMWMAVFADVGAALLVVANGLRALRK